MTKRLIFALTIILAAAAAMFADGNVNVVNPTSRPVPVNVVTRVAGASLAEQFYAAHITTAATTTVTSTTCYVSTVVISCSNAGTTYTIRVQDKSGTPKILIPTTAALTVPTTGVPNVSLLWDEPILFTGGIDIITAGTPGVVDVWLTYWQ